MKDDQEHIDKLFESLNDREFPIPEAFLEDLNKRLDNEPKRKKFFFLWFLAPLVLIGAIGICYFLFSDKSTAPVNQENKLIAKDEYKENSKSHPDSYRDQNTYPISGQSQNSQQSVDSTAVSLQPGNPQVNTSKNTKQQTKSSHSIQLAETKLKTKNASQKSTAKIHTGKQTPGKKSEKNITSQKSSNLATSPSEMGSKILLSTNDREKTQDKITPTSAPEQKVGSSSTGRELAKDSLAETKTDSTIAQNTVDTIQETDSSQVEKDKITSKTLTGDWKKEIQLFAGLGGNSIHDSSKNPEYLSKINQNQSSILAPSFGVNANLSYKKFTFGLGVKYEQTGEKFKVDIKSTELKDSTYSEIIQDTVWVQDSLGNWFPTIQDSTIYHTVQYMDSVQNSQSFQNRYSWISIPLHFGYRFELGDYELIPRLGAIFNFGITQGMGSYPNTSFNNVNKYKPVKFNVSYLIQLEVRRNFDKCFIFVNPYFQSMINPSVSGDVIRRRYSSWGMQFGIGFKL